MPGLSTEVAATRQQWDAHLLAQMALPEGRGWSLDPDGSVLLVIPWPQAAARRPFLVDDPEYISPNCHRIDVGQPRRSQLQDGDLVWVGTGPHGERGATLDDIAGLQTAGVTW